MRKLAYFLATVSFAGLAASCNSNDDYCFESQNPLPDAVTRSANSTGNYVFLDIYGTKYNTFLLAPGYDYVYVGRKNPFEYYETGETDANGKAIMAMFTNCEGYHLLEEKCCTLTFKDEGLRSCVDLPYPGGLLHVPDTIRIGEPLAIWASEEKYTNEDLKAHNGDLEYFTKVANSFKCYYKTTLRRHMVIDYDRIVENEWTVWGAD